LGANPSRIERARRRVAGAKRTAVAVAAAGFLAIALLARQSHPGHAASASSGSGGSTGARSDSHDDFGLRAGSMTQSGGSSGGAQTSVS
jgi:hypothetical protein